VIARIARAALGRGGREPRPDFTRRLDATEWMDDPELPENAVREASRELDVINDRLGGFSATLHLLAVRLRALPGPVSVLDVGSGGGGCARLLARWGERNGVPVRVTALDLHPVACRIAAETAARGRISVVRADGRRLPFADRAFHFAHCALFLHHFSDREILEVLAEMRRVSSDGVVVNDLERHPVAFHAIRVLARLFSKSPLVRHDGPVSVRRGFRAADVERWRASLGSSLGHRRRWPFRIVAWAFADGGAPEGAP
jgi:ubiquinone/menaquinone biosynthesis C-methylase UbiE